MPAWSALRGVLGAVSGVRTKGMPELVQQLPALARQWAHRLHQKGMHFESGDTFFKET